MSAINPLSPDQKPREPSMEEILASIRRIIADDQFPRPAAAPEPSQPRPTVAPPEPPTAALEPLRGPVPEPSTFAYRPEPAAEPPLRAVEPAGHEVPRSPAEEREPAAYDRHPTHGAVTPQYPVPPVNDDRPAQSPISQRSEPPPPPAWHSQPEVPEPQVSEPDVSFYPSDPDAEVAGRHAYASTEPPIAPPDITSAAPVEPEEPVEAYEVPLGSAADEPQEETAPALFSAATDTALSSAFNMLAATRLADNSEELKGMVREMIRPLLRSWLDDNLPPMVERMVRAEIERVARGGR